jgi:hypothetical protein
MWIKLDEKEMKVLVSTAIAKAAADEADYLDALTAGAVRIASARVAAWRAMAWSRLDEPEGSRLGDEARATTARLSRENLMKLVAGVESVPPSREVDPSTLLTAAVDHPRGDVVVAFGSGSESIMDHFDEERAVPDYRRVQVWVDVEV